MSELARILRKPIEVPLPDGNGGVFVLKLSRLNDRIRLSCEEWAEARVTASYEKVIRLAAPEEQGRLREQLQTALLGHHYAFGRPAFLEQLNTFEGVTFLLVRLLEANHEGVTDDEVVGLFTQFGPQLRDALDRVLSDEAGKKKAPPEAIPVAAAAPTSTP